MKTLLLSILLIIGCVTYAQPNLIWGKKIQATDTLQYDKVFKFPNPKYNSTTSSDYWRFANGQRFGLFRADTFYQSLTGIISNLNIHFGRNAGNLTEAGGGGNISMGDSSQTALTTGFGNQAFGFKALTANTTGNYNVAIGNLALASNTTVSSLVGVGYQALRGFVGTTGFNTAIGNSTMVGLTTGSYNTAVGADAQRTTTTTYTGSYNVSVGGASMRYLTTGSNNTGIGYHVGHILSTGTSNSAVGYYSLHNATTGNNNTAIGDSSLMQVTTGSGNIALGNMAGYNLTTESNEFFVNNARHSSLANSKIYSLLWGTMSGTSDSKSGNQLTINGDFKVDKYYLNALNTAPASASDTGTAGEIRIDASFIYVCTATNTWKRIAIATW